MSRPISHYSCQLEDRFKGMPISINLSLLQTASLQPRFVQIINPELPMILIFVCQTPRESL